MKKFPETFTQFYCAEIVLALEELHLNGIVYRDLKPENILLDGEGHIKLADFGLAKENITEAAEGAHSLCGTPEYLSPEVLNRQGHGHAVDWWNLGMVCYEMLTGLPPWYTQDKELLFERLKNAPLKFPNYVSKLASSFIQVNLIYLPQYKIIQIFIYIYIYSQKLLHRQPADRLGSNGAHEVKSHPFFDNINWDALYYKEIRPPFNPLQNQDPEDSRNFEAEFTSLPVHSIDENYRESRADRISSSTFENFTYEEDSYLDSRIK
jgi:serine/threonine protein kinase